MILAKIFPSLPKSISSSFNLINSSSIHHQSKSQIHLNAVKSDERQISKLALQNRYFFSQFKGQGTQRPQPNLQKNQQNSKMFQERKKQKVRDKYLNDYLLYKSVPYQFRGEQLQRILMTPPSEQQHSLRFLETNKHKEEWYQYNGTRLRSYIWEPTNQSPKAVIVYFNSLNSHSLIISQFAQKMTKKGYVVASFDYPNFGKSQGKRRGNIQNFSSVAEPSESYFFHIKKCFPNTKCYIMGTSFGGAVGFCLANRLSNKQLNGLIMLSPAIRQNPYHMPFKKKLGALLAVTLPNFRLPKTKTRNGCKYRLDEYLKTDPYKYKQGMWTSTVWTMLSTMLNFAKQYKYLQKPYLIVQSGTDKLVDPFLAVDLQKVSPSKDKTTVIIHDMWHNVWFDDKRQEVMRIIQEWLQERNF